MSIATHCSFLLFNGELGAMQHRLSVIRTILHHLIAIRVDLRLQFPPITGHASAPSQCLTHVVWLLIVKRQVSCSEGAPRVED